MRVANIASQLAYIASSDFGLNFILEVWLKASFSRADLIPVLELVDFGVDLLIEFATALGVAVFVTFGPDIAGVLPLGVIRGV
jgi:hypothetical protein